MGIDVECVEFPELAKFQRESVALREVVRTHHLEGPWQQMTELLMMFHAKIARTPCRPSWLYAQNQFHNSFKQLGRQLESRASSASPPARLALEAVANSLKSLVIIDSNPLAGVANTLLSLFPTNEMALVILRDPGLWEEVQTQISQPSRTCLFKMRRPVELRLHEPTDNLILFGPPGLLEFRGESFLLRSPIARSVWVLMCKHERIGKMAGSLLNGQQDLAFKGASMPTRLPLTIEHEPASLFAPTTYVFRELSNSDEWRDHSEDMVLARPIILGGKRGVYAAADSSLYVIKTSINGEQRPCAGLERLQVGELEPGMLVLLSTEGGGDLIPTAADDLLGKEALQLRNLQKKWKTGLREAVAARGMVSTANWLTAHRCSIANTANIRYWCSLRSIAPDDLQTHFAAILEMIGLSPRLNEFVTCIRKLRKAHMIAARHLQRLLLRDLKTRDLRSAFVNGSQEIKDAAGGPVKTVFVVLKVESPIEINANLVGRMLVTEEIFDE